MQGLYPNQSKEFLEKRVAANKDFHSFYRAFAPLFYDVIKNDKDISRTFKPVSKFSSAMGGDVHVENFGFVTSATGNAKLALNDVDDVTYGPIYLDVIRHYISGKIVTDDVHWKNYISAYQAGLKDEEHEYSDYIKRNKQNASLEIKKILDEYISKDLPQRFSKFKRPMYLIDEATKTNIAISLNELFPKIKIEDQYLRIKEDGGSAGVRRYEILAQLSPGEDPVWLDIKAMTTSSYDKIYISTEPTNDKRMSLIKNYIYEKSIGNNIVTTKISGKDYYIRYMNQFCLGVSIEDIPANELSDAIIDEAYALGQTHARNFSQVGEYIKAWNNINPEDIKTSTKKIREELEMKYSSKI
jgi:hypothetical protein